MKDVQELDWEIILDYIESEQAALLIGPEVMQFDGRPMNQVWRESVWNAYKSKVAYFYQQDGLFLFSNKIAKNNATNHVRKFLNEREPDESIYKKIIQIKFPIVISINPDTYISDVAYKYGVKHRFSYFKSRSKAVEDVEEPQKDLPLFYNLCGTVNDDESVILDYEDLFKLISSSVSAPGLPPKLQAFLSKVRIFFFIGFQFEKWYTQLLLRLLCGQEESEKYASNRQYIEEHVCDFLLYQFQIDFLNPNQDFLDILHNQCAKRGLLRYLSDPASSNETRIIRLIQTSNDLYAPLEELRKQTEKSAATLESTLLLARYNNLMEEKKKGTLDSRDFFVEYNRIIDGILNVIRKAS